MRIQAFIVLILFISSNAIATSPHCYSHAITQAKKLLSFHTEGDDRAVVEPNVAPLPPISNPTNKSQKFIVLEVMGYVYKGQYRMRFIYYPLGGECVLMGQEILELANL